MIIRNGVNSTLRARGRAALFFALILLLTLALSLGLGMWSYCSRALGVLDESYTSIAVLEYMGEDYPDANVADEYARQANQALDKDTVATVDGVELWEPADQALVSLMGYRRDQDGIPYDAATVAVVANLAPMYRNGIQWQDDDFQLPENCMVINTVSMDVTCYATGLSPLVMPNYVSVGETFYRYVEQDGQWGMEPVEALPQGTPYLVNGRGPMGGIPIKYLAAQEGGTYYYDPTEKLYGVDGQVLYAYTGSIVDYLYCAQEKNGGLVIVEPGNTGFVPVSGKRYLFHGTLTQVASSNTTITVTDFPGGEDEPPYLELSGEDDPALTDSLFANYAAYYQTVNNYIRLEASDDIAALEAFHQGGLFLEQGRFPQAGEAGVCVVDGRTAMQLGLSLGDRVEPKILTSAQNDRFDLTVGQEDSVLEVVGITNPSKDYSGCMWVPSAEGGLDQLLFGYQLGRAVLDNAEARQAADALQTLAPDGVRVTLYDQGYFAAAQPLQAMRSTALAITAACLCGALAVLLLFGYLFVGRQQETVVILTCLGTPAGKVRLWLLSGVVVIAGAATVLGALAGWLSMGGILAVALDLARGLYVADQRYSEAAIGVVKEMPEMGTLPWWPTAAAAGGIFAAAVVLCLAFLSMARRKSTPRRGKISVRVPKGGTSTVGSGPARFAFLSALRGEWRSVMVPTAALTLTLLLGLLTSTAQGWSGQIARLYDTTTITGEVTSVNGRYATDLVVSTPNIRLLWESGMLEELSVSTGWQYWFADAMPAFGTGSFSAESRTAWINQQPQLVALNSLSVAPAFYYEAAPEVEWLAGWDESFLAASDTPSILDSMTFRGGEVTSIQRGDDWITYPCVVSRRLLSERGLALGDTFQIQMQLMIQNTTYVLSLNLQAVGSYGGAKDQRELYVPLAFWCDLDWIVGEEPPLADGERANINFSNEDERDGYFYATTTFSTCRFALRSAYDLNQFRNYLAEEQISQVGRLDMNRTTVVLRDQTFVETVSGLGRYITFSRILLPVLCGAVGLLGFLISWLMVNGRRMEFAIMRGLGASKGRVFWSFFLEQGALALLGCILGGLALIPLGAGWAGWLAAAGFWMCYLAGCALAVAFTGQVRPMALLQAQD